MPPFNLRKQVKKRALFILRRNYYISLYLIVKKGLAMGAWRQGLTIRTTAER